MVLFPGYRMELVFWRFVVGFGASLLTVFAAFAGGVVFAAVLGILGWVGRERPAGSGRAASRHVGAVDAAVGEDPAG